MDPQYTESQYPEAPSLRLKDYVRVIARRKWSLILPAAVIALIAVITALALPPVYRATSTILIEEQEIPQDFVTATVTSFAEQRLQVINQRIMSTTRLLEIINQFDLYKKLRAKKTTEEIVEKMRKDVSLKQVSSEVMDRRTGRATAVTIAFTLSYEGNESPQTVQRVATMLASLFLEENMKVRERQTQETYDFLDAETVRVKQDLEGTETALSLFKEAHINALPELMQVNVQSLQSAENNIERLMEQMRTLREREGYLEAQLATISPQTENSDRARLNELSVQMVHLQTRFSDTHPDVVKTREEIAVLEKKLYGDKEPKGAGGDLPDNPAYVTLTSQLASTRSDIESTTRQAKDYQAKAEEYRKRVEATPRVEGEYNALITRRQNLQAKYSDLLQKAMEAKVAQGLEKEQKGEKFTLIDPARFPEKPFKPNRMAILLVGCLLGVAAGVGVVVLREMGDQTVRNPDLITLATGFPVLAAIPLLVTEEDREKQRRRRIFWTWATLAGLVALVLIFHFLIMDLDILWIKVMRRAGNVMG